MSTRRNAWGRWGALSVALAFTSVGCHGDDDEDDDSASCSSLCEDGKDCKGADTSVDCRDACDESEAFVDRAGCSSQYDDYIDCFDHVSDICSVTTNDCPDETRALGTCVTNYCETHLEDEGCAV